MQVAENSFANRPAHWFKPGQSGNPGGRPALTDEARETIEALRKLTPRTLEVVIGCMADEDGNVRLKAVQMIWDRVYGKPRQQLDVKDEREGKVDAMPAAERVAYLEDAKRAIAAELERERGEAKAEREGAH